MQDSDVSLLFIYCRNMNDVDLEKQLKRNFWKKWKLMRAIKENSEMTEKFLLSDFSLLSSTIKEKDNQEKYLKESSDPEQRNNHRILLEKHCETEKLFNMIGFLDLVSLDIFTMMHYLLIAHNDRDRKFFARNACMLMYEMVDDVLTLLGCMKKENDDIYKIGNLVNDINDQDLSDALNEVRMDWNNFRKDIFKKKYNEVRNQTVAHKEHDFIKQYNAANIICWGEVVEDFIKFNHIFSVLRYFIKFFSEKYFEKYNQDVAPILESISSKYRSM